MCGTIISADDIITEVMKDYAFYQNSGGGITISGGEPLMQYDFTLSLLKLAKEQGLHTAIETSGYSNRNLTALNPYTDLWLYDIKIFPDVEHIKHTGVSNKVIFDNLYQLDNVGANIILRCPIIPDINMAIEHFENLAKLSSSFKGVSAIHLEPYHPLGISKALQLGKIQTYQNNKFLKPLEIRRFADELSLKTNIQTVIL